MNKEHLYDKFSMLPRDIIDEVTKLTEEEIEKLLNADPKDNPYVDVENRVLQTVTVENNILE